MLSCKNIIVITQQGAGRSLEITFDFCHAFKIESSWEDLTSTAEITMPRKIRGKNQYNADFSLYSKDFNVGGFNNDNPLIKRGDRVQIYAGYTQNGNNSTGLWFDGFISQVDTGKPFVLKCEDYMWKLKQTPAPNKIWKGYTISSMLREMLQGTDVTLNSTSNIGITYDVGYFTTHNMSIAQVLEKLRKDVNLYSYIRGTELRVGYPLYIESEATTHTFTFQKDIIDNDLVYKRKDDVVLSAIAKTIDTQTTGTTKSGKTKIKKVRKQILVYLKNGQFTSEDITDKDAPANVEGERRTFNYFPDTATDIMISDAKERLKKYYYSGYKGTFLTFGYPFVQHGDNVTIVNPVLVEMQDTYKVKKVTYTGGVNGLRQEILLDYKTT